MSINLNETYWDGDVCLKPLTEATLGQVLRRHKDTGFVIISPCRSKENLEKLYGKTLTDEEAIDINNKRVKEFKDLLKDIGYSYIHAYGGYHENGTEDFSYEKSFIVYPFDRSGYETDYEAFFEDMLKIGRDYNQDSILRKHPDEKAMYVLCSDGSVDIEFNGVTTNDIAKEYFTALRQNDHKYGDLKRFTYEGLMIEKAASNLDGHRKWARNELFLQN